MSHEDHRPKCTCGQAIKIDNLLVQDQNIPVSQQGAAYLQCKLCLAELPDGISPSDFARQEVALTDVGIQVWCKRHECNIVQISFRDHGLGYNTGRLSS